MDLPDCDAPSLSDAQIWILKIWQKTFHPPENSRERILAGKSESKKQQDSFTNTFVEVLQKPTTWVPQNFF